MLRRRSFFLVLGVLAPILATAPGHPVLADDAATAAASIDCGALSNTLAANDDGSTGAVTLPFAANFYGAQYQALYVNNNGNVTFNGPLGTYTPFGISANTAPIIAPFFADVDTRGVGSGLVHYGTTQFGSRTAFCVNWFDVTGGVGYFSGQTDKLNSFQLVLVDRGDVGPGDFDIMFNYDGLTWETGSASGGINGYGGTPAGAGFSAGDGVADHFVELTGSRVSGSFIDPAPDGSANPGGLAHQSRNSLVPGRFVFPIRNGGTGLGATVSGHVTDTSNTGVADALVQICATNGALRCAYNGRTDVSGAYTANALTGGDYQLRVFGPAGTALQSVTVPIASLGDTEEREVDATLVGPTPPAPGTSIDSIGNSGGIPVVYWNAALGLSTTGCVSGTATYQVTLEDGNVARSGTMTETPPGSGHYSTTIDPLYPNHGSGHVAIVITCGAEVDDVRFDIYIDPSGFVRTTTGAPIAGAAVTLYRSDSAGGPFAPVADGSDVMSAANRANPSTTGADGHFGWDVITGFYQVTASKAGCFAPGDPGEPTVTSPVLEIPPAVLDLDLRLECPATPPVNQPPTAGADSVTTAEDTPVTFDVLANDSDDAGTAGLQLTITPPATGAAVLNADRTITFTPAPNWSGQVQLAYEITDAGGLSATATATIDVTPVNDPPVAVSPAAITANVGGSAVSIDWASGASDVDGDALTATASVTGAGSVVVNGGTLVYTPPATNPAALVATIDYVVSDGHGDSAAGSLGVTLTPLAPPPPPSATLQVTGFLGSGKTVVASGRLVATTACSDWVSVTVAGQTVTVSRPGVKTGNVCTSLQTTSAGTLLIARDLRTGAWAAAATFARTPALAVQTAVSLTVGDDTAATTITLWKLGGLWTLR